MLMGEYLHTIDAKARVFVPAKLRDGLGESFTIAKNIDGCLSLYSAEEWSKLCAKIELLPDSQTREIKRFIFAFAFEVSPDSHGRITLPQVLRDFANLDREAVFLGLGNRAELWDANRWNAMKTGDNIAEIEKQMKELGL